MIQHFDAPDGTRLAFRDEGEGLPVLCLSGLTRNGTDFDYIAPHLRDVRLIRLDYRGRGASDWADPSTYTIPTEGRDALALLDHLDIPRAAILGTSRGGMIAMYLTSIARDRMIGVCFNDIGPELSLEGLSVIQGYIGRNPVATSLPDLARARARLLAGFENVPDSRWMEEAEKHYIDTGDGLTINYDPGLAQIFKAPPPGAEVLPSDWWPFFDALDGAPIGLVRGANSDLLTEETAAEMMRRRTDMLYANIADRGHVPFLDEEPAVRLIRTWVDRCKEAAA